MPRSDMSMGPTTPLMSLHRGSMGGGALLIVRAVAAAVLVLSRCPTLVDGAIEKDLIRQLPGWAKPLPSRQYSGYLAVPGDHGLKMYHYWFVESESDPATDPVALW
jgi:hypothetical protein